LGQLVVEDDAVAAAGIELLKQTGWTGDVPLNKIKPHNTSQQFALRYADGFIDYAINLIDCDRCYRDVFAYVFGSTVILKP